MTRTRTKSCNFVEKEDTQHAEMQLEFAETIALQPWPSRQESSSDDMEPAKQNAPYVLNKN